VAPTGIVTDRYQVYWTAASAMAAPLYGGDAVTLAPSAGAQSLASDGENLYWSGNGITAFHFATGCVSQVAPGPLGAPTFVATDGVNVYYLDPGTSTVFQVPVGGGSPLALMQGEGYGGLAADGTNVYVVGVGQGGALESVPVGGGTVTTLAGSQYGQGVAVDDANVYWTSFNPSLSGSNVASMPKSGGTPTVLVGAYAAGNQPDALALDGDTLYWADFADNTIREVSVNGGTPSVVATTPNGEVFQEASGLAVSRKAIYWATLSLSDASKSTVWMAAK
jgi:hypothetical protein